MQDFFSLKNKTILVTGASSGIGKQTAINISKMGANLFITGRNEERLKQTLAEMEGKHQIIVSDLTKEKDLIHLVENIEHLDGLVYCAGISKSLPIKFIKQPYLFDIQKINYESAVILSATLLKKKKINKNASIVFVSSIAAQHPYKGGAVYAGSKAALEAFARSLALELAHRKIRVNCLAPAMVKTDMYETTKAAVSTAAMEKDAMRYPLGIGQSDDVANASIFLLSSASRWITGQTICLDGGLMLGA
ncbi:MAG: SDR family NAD(P)-dependent oxidoreductase [Chitinophagales bacterium]